MERQVERRRQTVFVVQRSIHQANVNPININILNSGAFSSPLRQHCLLSAVSEASDIDVGHNFRTAYQIDRRPKQFFEQYKKFVNIAFPVQWIPFSCLLYDYWFWFPFTFTRCVCALFNLFKVEVFRGLMVLIVGQFVG